MAFSVKKNLRWCTPFWTKWRCSFDRNKPPCALVLLMAFVCGFVPARASDPRVNNRDPSLGKVHVQNHTQVDKAPFFQLKPFRLMILSRKSPVAIFCFDLILETHSEKTKGLLEKHLPRIYSALLEDFYGVGFLLWGTGYHTTSFALKQRAERVVRRFVQDDLLRDVMIQKVLLKAIPATQKDT